MSLEVAPPGRTACAAQLLSRTASHRRLRRPATRSRSSSRKKPKCRAARQKKIAAALDRHESGRWRQTDRTRCRRNGEPLGTAADERIHFVFQAVNARIEQPGLLNELELRLAIIMEAHKKQAVATRGQLAVGGGGIE